MSMSSAVRFAKIGLISFVSAHSGIVALGNVMDPDVNLEFVRHVLTMDTTLGRDALSSRAIESDALHRLAFGLIVVAEALIAVLSGWGAWRLWRVFEARAEIFHAAKAASVIALLLALALFFFGFQVVGGEWFSSWQSSDWNGLDAAARLSATYLLMLIFVTMKND